MTVFLRHFKGGSWEYAPCEQGFAVFSKDFAKMPRKLTPRNHAPLTGCQEGFGQLTPGENEMECVMGDPMMDLPARRQGFTVFQVRGAVLICVLLILTLMAASGVQARPDLALIVRDDHGGLISQRSQEIIQLQRTGQTVQIEGDCLSSCTMYLALQNTCVTPETRLGFHAPQIAGQRLAVSDFEHWSQEVARHYPEPLKTWYMREGRLRQAGYFSIRGADLIRLGIPACPA